MIDVAAFYHFASFDDPASLRDPLRHLCRAHAVKGTILLAREGVNGTIAGSRSSVAAIIEHISALPGCAALSVKYSHATEMPFLRLRVRLRPEIVTLGVAGVDPVRSGGRYVDAAQWNALISDPATIVIDTRNDYEIAIGTFKGAINPGTASFRDFPAWFRAFRHKLPAEPKIAMFCTGGIRCEKSTAFLRAQGIVDVAHLKGGILTYLETVAPADSLWEGECFVFDDRVSVSHGLSIGTYSSCRACGNPVSFEDLTSLLYREGVQCAGCAHTRTEDQRAGDAERQRQFVLAQTRGSRFLSRD